MSHKNIENLYKYSQKWIFSTFRMLNNIDPKEIKLNRLCRTCLNDVNEERESFFLSSSLDVEGKSIPLSELFTNFVGIKCLLDNKIPQIICKYCVSNLKNAFAFKQQCIQADLLIQKILKDVHCLRNNYIEDKLTLNHDLKSEKNTTSKLNTRSSKLVSNSNNLDFEEDRSELGLKSSFIKNSCEGLYSNKPINSILKRRIKPPIKSIYSCKICKETFDNRQNLKTHSISHFSRRLHKCSICSKDFKHQFQLKEHMRGHEDKKEFICEICGKRFNRNKELVIHKRVHTGLKPYTCVLCNKSFGGSDTLAKHMRIHVSEKSFVCEYCMKGFMTKDQLKVHIRKHTGEKPYFCTFLNCERKFATVHSLNMHLPVHTNEKPFNCSFCEKTFARCQDKRKHENIHKRQDVSESSQNVMEESAVKQSNKQALCTHCGKSFIRKADLKRHIFTHTQERPFKCTHCDKGFNQKFGLTQHLRYHEGETCYICDLCGKGFVRKATLEKHKLIHSGIKNYKCEYCNKAFTLNAHLIRHRRVHTGERPYECKICNKAFSTRSGYVVHLRSHTGEKPYQCKYCEKTCATSSALKIHTRNHTGEKPYLCSKCGTAFSRSDLRSLHYKTCFTNEMTDNYETENEKCNNLVPVDSNGIQVGHQIRYSNMEKNFNSILISDLSETNLILSEHNDMSHHISNNLPGPSKDSSIISSDLYN